MLFPAFIWYKFNCWKYSAAGIRDVLLKQIEATREIVLTALDHDFELRSRALDKQLDLIEKALDNNNLDALNLGLQSLVSNIQASPFKNVNFFKQIQNNGDKLLEI